ncbi:MAG: hypothetical protein SVR04_03735 [Spirochaetota bacterium]|nr:hypothetical protein [Spirochaetota bacterium]
MKKNNTILKQSVSNTIHEGKQFPEGRSFAYLTVGRIGKYTGIGRLDFGGSEYAEADVEWLAPVKKSSDDTYGWWHLTPGAYLVLFNESVEVPAGKRFYLQIWEKAARNAASIPFAILEGGQGSAGQKPDRQPSAGQGAAGQDSGPDPLSCTLFVGGAGIEIKENARLAQLGVLD